MNIDFTQYLVLFTKSKIFQIYDDDIYKSVLNSERQFCDITINLKGCRCLLSNERIEAIVKKFSSRVKKFKISCSVQGETTEIADLHMIKLLKLIPHVEELVLLNVYIRSDNSAKRFDELDLHKLKKLVLNYCLFDDTVVLDLIPVNVLNDLVFTFDSLDETIYQNFFNRQGKIKKLELFENDQIEFNHLELEHIKISSSIDYCAMLSQQPKLRYIDFAISWIDDMVFSGLLQLKHLEVLKTLIDQVPCRVFKGLNKLKQLKELRLDSHSSFDCGHLLALSMMNGMKLEKLTLYYTEREIPEEILVQISKNFLNLKHLELINRSIRILSRVIEYFTNLESILMDFYAIFFAPDDLEISDGLRHQNLKQIVITNTNTTEVKNTETLLKLVNACPNLERIMLSKLTDVSLNDFEDIMKKHQNLTHLSLEFNDFKFDLDVILVVAELAKNLQHLRLSRLSNYPTYKTIQNLFEDNFSKITFYKYNTGEGELVMKKRGVQDWYLNFNLRDHF